MNWLRDLLLDNLGLKLVALLLAMVVYLHVYTERPATMIVAFPLQIADLPDTLAIASAVPEAILAELRGTGKQLIRIRLTEPQLKVSLAGVGPGRFQRAITVDDLPLMAADRLQIERMIGPHVLDLQVERKLLRQLPVAARVDTHLPAGVTWDGTVFVDPAVVEVRGPWKALAGLDSLRLESVRVDGHRDTLRQEVKPAGLPPGCELDPARITVIVPVSRRR